jgi:hypothetical protein
MVHPVTLIENMPLTFIQHHCLRSLVFSAASVDIIAFCMGASDDVGQSLALSS